MVVVVRAQYAEVCPAPLIRQLHIRHINQVKVVRQKQQMGLVMLQSGFVVNHPLIQSALAVIMSVKKPIQIYHITLLDKVQPVAVQNLMKPI